MAQRGTAHRFQFFSLFVVSLSGHLLLLLYLGDPTPKTRPSSTTQPTAEESDVYIVSSLPEAGETHQSDETKKAEQARRLSQVEISDLLPKWKKGSDGGKPNKPRGRSGYDPHGKGGAMAVLNSMTAEEYHPQLGFFEHLRNKIHFATEYPEVIAKERIAGSVSVHLEVTKTGVFPGQFLKVVGTDKLLKTYVLATLIQTLKQPLPNKVWLKSRDTIPLILNFDFDLRMEGDRSPFPEPNSFKNSLRFHRVAYVEPLVYEKMNKVLTKYLPPILPLPGGFFVDVIRAYQFVKNLTEPTDEERQEQRLHLLRAKLEATIGR